MSEHHATVSWLRATADFAYDTFNREHQWTFSGGQTITASAAPDYKGDPAGVDPEEGLAAALAGCHMLTFLAIAAKKRYTVDRYESEAIAHAGKNEDGAMAVLRIELRPRVEFSGDRQPTPEDITRLHEKAHQHCFIANSIKSAVVVLEE